jgi:hypothetical protein
MDTRQRVVPILQLALVPPTLFLVGVLMACWVFHVTAKAAVALGWEHWYNTDHDG